MMMHLAGSSKSGAAPWSDLNHDVLFLVMMQLKVVDFVAFSGVCKSWRSLALSNRNIFMASNPPMLISFSSRAYKTDWYCCLEDCEGRKFKTIIPHSDGRFYVGLTCGYLVFYGERTHDFWLVNPITRDELHFPRFPSFEFVDPIKVIVVFSRRISDWVLLVLRKYSRTILFSTAGKGLWNHVFSTTYHIIDFHALKGKIYTVNIGGSLCELKLHPKPKLRLLHDPYIVQELNSGKKKMVSPEEETIGQHAFFLSVLKNGDTIKPESWAGHWSQYMIYNCFRYDDSGVDWIPVMRYFPHECMSVNLIDE